MSKTIEVEVFRLDELNEAARERVLNKFAEWAGGDSFWYEHIEEDAKDIGLKITEMDTYRGSANGEWTEDATYTAYKIIENHGDVCETHKTAKTFLRDRDELVASWPKDEDGEFENEGDLDDQLDELEDEFRRSLLEDYRIMAEREYEYQTSAEAIRENIEANDYWFTEAGVLA